MSTLDSSSTYTQIVAAYEDNASWFEDNSVSKALAFITACKFLIRRIPKLQRNDKSETEFSVKEVQAEMTKAESFVATKGRSGTNKSYRQIHMGEFRR